MEKTQIINALSNHYLFAPLTNAQHENVLHHARIQNYTESSLIFHKNQPAHYFYYVINGGVRLYFSAPDGKEKTVRIFEKGSSFAEALMFMNRDSYPANAAAITNTQLLAIDSHHYRKMIIETPALATALLGHCCEHIHNLSRQIEMLSVLDASSRLTQYLRHQLPANAKNGTILRLPMAKKELAEFLAIRPETLSRVMRQLEIEGALERCADGFIVRDIQKIK